MRVLGKILLCFLVAWALVVSVLSFFGLTVIFPWKISETGEIPQLRAEVVRISIFLTSFIMADYIFLTELANTYPFTFYPVTFFI